MGQNNNTFHNLTTEQQTILTAVAETPYISKHFYFTGGTLLHSYYFAHRYSEDLDFFTEEELNTSIIETYMAKWSNLYHFTYTAQFVDVVYIFILTFPDGEKLKVDFAYYPHKAIKERKQINGLTIDALYDIAVNKLICIQQRTNMKDYVDLYYLIQEFSIWTISYGLKEKYNMKFDPIFTAADMLKVLEMDRLPRMISSLTLKELKNFYIQQAKSLGYKVIDAI